LSALDPGLRRVSVHADTAIIDLALPAGVPVATLIPSIVDILNRDDDNALADRATKSYQLCPLGAPALPPSTTLAQNEIRDGAVLLLSQPPIPPPVVRYDDMADAVAATIEATTLPHNPRSTQLTGAVAAGALAAIGGLALVGTAPGGNTNRGFATTATVAALAGLVALLSASIAHRTYQNAIAGVTLSLIATGLAAVACFLAIPGTPGGPNLLLAAMAAAVTSTLAPRVTDCGVVTLTAVACFSLVVAAAALAAVLTAAPPYVIGSVCALLSLGLLGLAGRVSIALSGLSPQLPVTPFPATLELRDDLLHAKVIRADRWSTSLLAAFAWSAAVGAVVTALSGALRPGCVTFAAITSGLLLSRARHDRRRTLMFAVAGIASAGGTFGMIAVRTPDHGPWIALLTVMMAAAAVYLGFVAPGMSFSPAVQRGVDLLECLALVVLVPLTCWICGLFQAVRGLGHA
jgi:type VII secretion integral membrane protein EccD